MSRYVRIATRFWHDEKVQQLSPEEKLLFMYLLTSPHSNMIGFYMLPKLYACADLGMVPERLSKLFDKLLSNGLINYDETTSVILIPNFLKYNPIQNKNQAIGAAKAAMEIPRNSLFSEFLEAMGRYAGQHLQAFKEEFPNGFETVTLTVPQTVSNTATATATATESVTESILSASEKPTVQENSHQVIFQHWNEKEIIQHRALNDKTKRAINGALRDYSLEEITNAIDNYAKILGDKRYYFEYKWTLHHFLQRGLEQFIDWDVCSHNYARGDPIGPKIGATMPQNVATALSLVEKYEREENG